MNGAIEKGAGKWYIYFVNIVDRAGFVWDEAKNRINHRKHGIPFAEAQTVFLDENAFEFFDPDHSAEEDRYLLLGLSTHSRVLVVCHCYREGQIRIISARKADVLEREDYRKGLP